MDHILSLSYGKDSLAAIHVAVDILHWPLDRIVHAEVWATDTVPADLPPMADFKDKADRIIKERWGIKVEHYSATNIDGIKRDRVTYQDGFYHVLKSGKNEGNIKGWPMLKGPWCQKLKLDPFSACNATDIQYLGIAADEPERIARHINTPGIKLPLVEAGWTEAMCRQWCEENGILSPIYTCADRGGCWFCHNQGVDQLRLLRKNYPERWALMLKWDKDSPVTFHADGHTVHDFDARFALEDVGQIAAGDTRFRWDCIDQMSCFMEV